MISIIQYNLNIKIKFNTHELLKTKSNVLHVLIPYFYVNDGTVFNSNYNVVLIQCWLCKSIYFIF